MCWRRSIDHSIDGRGRVEGEMGHLGIHPSPPATSPARGEGSFSHSPSPREESHPLPRSVVLEAYRGEQLLGAGRVQRQPGRTASFEPAPRHRESARNSRLAERVVQALMEQRSLSPWKAAPGCCKCCRKPTLAPTPGACRMPDFNMRPNCCIWSVTVGAFPESCARRVTRIRTARARDPAER